MEAMHPQHLLQRCWFVACVLCLIVAPVCAQEFDPGEVEEQLVGTWVAEDDQKSNWVFTEDMLQDYYDGELQAQDPFSVVYECRGEEAHEHDAGMLLVESESDADICAVIQGLSEERLTLLSIPSGRLILFVREDHMEH